MLSGGSAFKLFYICALKFYLKQKKMKTKNADNFRNACEAALQVFAKLKIEKYVDLQAKLDYCIGSYDYDKNPVGLMIPTFFLTIAAVIFVVLLWGPGLPRLAGVSTSVAP